MKISPHVSIYKFPIVALSSITTRITGVALTGMFIGSGFFCLLPSKHQQKVKSSYNAFPEHVKNGINYIALFPVCYHSLGGLRHFIWDKYPEYLSNIKVTRSSQFLFGSSLLLTYSAEKILKKVI
tara:strand:+ start:2341 stop:2715 length:375 start_codon:yes stop_codon:yes gene_type:complete